MRETKVHYMKPSDSGLHATKKLVAMQQPKIVSICLRFIVYRIVRFKRNFFWIAGAIAIDTFENEAFLYAVYSTRWRFK